MTAPLSPTSGGGTPPGAQTMTSPSNPNALPPATNLSMDQILAIKEMRDLFVLGLVNVNLGIDQIAIDMVRSTLDGSQE